MPIVIRKWNYADAVTIVQLNEQWGYATTLPEMNLRLQMLATLSDHELFIAESENKVVGFLHVYRHFSMGSAAFAEIGGLVVNENQRQKGIGKILVEEAKRWAKQHDMNKVIVRSNIKRADTGAFYPKCGFTLSKQQNVFRLDLP